MEILYKCFVYEDFIQCFIYILYSVLYIEIFRDFIYVIKLRCTYVSDFL